MRVTTDCCGFCGFCGSFSQTVDIAYFHRFLACGSLVVFACGFVVVWFCCGFWIARSALRPLHAPKKPQKAHDVVFVVFVVFVGFMVFVGFVDLRSHVVVKGEPHKDLTTDSIMC